MDIYELDGQVCGTLFRLYGISGSLSGLEGKKMESSIQIGPSDFTTKPYEGTYDIYPTFETQVVSTKNRKLAEDLTVNPVSYSTASTSDINNMF